MNDDEFMDDLMKMAMITPTEREVLSKMVDNIKQQLPSQFVDTLIPFAALYAMAGIDAYREFLYAMMAIGYSLRDDEEMKKPQKFTADDFRENT